MDDKRPARIMGHLEMRFPFYQPYIPLFFAVSNFERTVRIQFGIGSVGQKDIGLLADRGTIHGLRLFTSPDVGLKPDGILLHHQGESQGQKRQYGGQRHQW